MEKFDISRIDAHTLKVLVSVYEHGSISRAAEAFDLNQSTISHTVDKLRNAVGDPLFVKAGREIVPTKRAKDLIPRARQIIALMEGLVQPDELSPHPDAEPVTVAGNITALLPSFLRLRGMIRTEFPNAKLRFLEAGSRQNLERVLSSEAAEVVVTARSPSYPPTIKTQEVQSDALVIFYDPEMRGPVKTAQDYSAARHAALDFGGNRKSIVATALEENAITREVFLAVSNVADLGQYIQGTELITTMQLGLARSCFSHLAWCPAPFPLPRLSFDAAWHLRHDKSRRSVWLRDRIAQAFEEPDDDLTVRL